MLIISILTIQVVTVQGMYVMAAKSIKKQPVRFRLYNKGPFFDYYMYIQSQKESPIKLSKMVDISPTLPQTWWERLWGKPGNPNPEYYALLKDFEENAAFRAEKKLTPSVNDKSEQRIILLGFTKDNMPIYQRIDAPEVPVSIKE